MAGISDNLTLHLLLVSQSSCTTIVMGQTYLVVVAVTANNKRCPSSQVETVILVFFFQTSGDNYNQHQHWCVCVEFVAILSLHLLLAFTFVMALHGAVCKGACSQGF
jgi:hypothetical protein